MRFHILGSIAVHMNGNAINLGATKVRGMLGILLLAGNTAVPVDTLIARLWDAQEDEDPVGRATGARGLPPNTKRPLQTYVSRLRAALERAEVPARLVHEPGAYRLSLDRDTVDYHRFRALVGSGRQASAAGDFARAVTILREALTLWHGPPLADLATSWAQERREALVTYDLLPAYYDLFDAELALGHHDRVRAELRPLMTDHDTDEKFAELWMRAVSAGDGPATLPRYFRAYADRVRKALDTDPTDHLVQIYLRLVRAEAAGEPPRIVPREIPHPTPYFAGRHEELAKLDTLLIADSDAPALVAISGPPGVGKSELVNYWANTRRNQFSGGDLHYNLNGFGLGPPANPSDVLSAFAEALGHPSQHLPQNTAERSAALRRLLARRRVLVVLDNARNSAHIRPLLAATADCSVIITSQQQLTAIAHRDGAWRMTLPTMSDDESVELLNRRIGETRAAGEPDAIRDLGALCDGLPLGLRIVAEHAAAVPDAPVRDLVATLKHRRRMLLDAGSYGDDDTNTLRAVFTFAYEVRAADVARLYRLLGLFPSTQFTMPAAAALAELSTEEAERMLAVLVGAHLANQLGSDRFVLHDLLHLFVTELASHESPQVRRAALHRLFDWYLGTTINAVRLVSPHLREVSPLAFTSGATPQVFDTADEAMQWCISQRTTVLAIGRLTVKEGFDDHAWRLIGAFDDILHRFGNPRDLFEIQHAALDAARRSGSLYGQAGHLNNLGLNHFNLTEYGEAERYFQQTYELLRGTEFVDLGTTTLHNIATIQRNRGAYERAVELYQECLSAFASTGYQLGQAQARYHLGDTYRRMGRHDTASGHLQGALELYRNLTDARGQGEALAALGQMRLEQRDYRASIECCKEALAFSRRAMDERTIVESLITMATALCRLDTYHDAIGFASEAAQICRSTGNLPGLADALEIRGEAHSGVGDTTSAAADWQECITILQGPHDTRSESIQHRLRMLDLPSAPTQSP
jgi:DNA-binding SARP family transcriptional activator